SGRDLEAARRAYRDAPLRPVADYVVNGQRQIEVGSGKGRHTEYLLRMALSEPSPRAPGSHELPVSSRVHRAPRKGRHWHARIGSGGVVFDPELTGVEREKRKWLWVFALVLSVAGAIVLTMALRRQ